LKFFSAAWHSGDMPDEEATRIPAAYEAHVRELAPALPAPAQRLVRETSLHDGVMRSVSQEGDTLNLLFRAGDQQAGYFDARLRYTAVQVTPATEQFLCAIVGNRDVELLYDEFDSAGDGKQWVHRLLFWPYHEVSIQFGAFDLEVTPAVRRFDEGQDGNCCEQMRGQMQHTCDAHPDLSDCPDSLVVRQGEPGNFGLRVHDGGNAFIRIRYCPWCGVDLWSGGRVS
jgi:hypothetical protein